MIFPKRQCDEPPARQLLTANPTLFPFLRVISQPSLLIPCFSQPGNFSVNLLDSVQHPRLAAPPARSGNVR